MSTDGPIYEGPERRSEPLGKHTVLTVGVVVPVLVFAVGLAGAWHDLKGRTEDNADQLSAMSKKLDAQSDSTRLTRVEVELEQLKREAWRKDDMRRLSAVARQASPSLARFPSPESVLNTWERLAWPAAEGFPYLEPTLTPPTTGDAHP